MRTGPRTGWHGNGPRDRRGRSPRSATGAHACAARVGSRRQPLATLAAPPLDDLPAAPGAHAGAEPVVSGPLALLGLIGPLHDRRRSIGRAWAGDEVTDLEPNRSFFAKCGLRPGTPAAPLRRASMIGRRVTRSASRRSHRDLGAHPGRPR